MVGPLGHTLPFSIDFHHIPHGSPSVPATNSFKSHQIPHIFLELLCVISFEFPSDFQQFPESAPCHFLVNSTMFSEVPRRGPLPFSFQSHQITHRFPGVSSRRLWMRATSHDLLNTFCLLCNPPLSFPPRPPAERPAFPRHSSKSNLVTCDADAEADATPRHANANDNDNTNADADADADADATARHAMPCHAMPRPPCQADATPRHATSNRVSLELRSLSPQLLGGRASQTGPLL